MFSDKFIIPVSRGAAWTILGLYVVCLYNFLAVL